jgi:hypothetical protein
VKSPEPEPDGHSDIESVTPTTNEVSRPGSVTRSSGVLRHSDVMLTNGGCGGMRASNSVENILHMNNNSHNNTQNDDAL